MPALRITGFVHGRYQSADREYQPGDTIPFPCPWSPEPVTWTVPAEPGEYTVTAQDTDGVARVLAQIKITES